jgi:hypothetical protein
MATRKQKPSGPKRDKKGRWMRGACGNPKGPAITIQNGDLAQLIASKANLGRLAESILRRAYEGDSSSQAQVLKIIERQQRLAHPDSADRDYSKLSDRDLKALVGLTRRAMGQTVPDSEIYPPNTAPVSVEDEIELIAERTAPMPDDDDDAEEPPLRAAEIPPVNLPDPDSDPDLLENQQTQQRERDRAARENLYGKSEPGTDLNSGLRRPSPWRPENIFPARWKN